MRGRRFARALKFVLFGLIAAAALSFIVMRLWNWVIPPLLGLHAIGYWQALALLALTRILFGGFRGGFAGRMHWRGRMMERWSQMTPEEREKFRAGMGAAFGGGRMGRGCGPFSGSVPEAKA